MNSPTKKIITAIAWGLAFDSATEMLLAGLWGGRAGLKGGLLMKAGQTPEEAAATLEKEMGSYSESTYIPLIAGALGFLLALKGLLPGTQD